MNEKIENTKKLINAAKLGHFNRVNELIPVSDPKANGSLALSLAAYYGHIKVVKLLIPVSDPKDDNSQALRWAAEKGHTEIVKLLIPVSDPKAEYSEALTNAAMNGRIEVVKLLIPVSDPKANNSLALRWAWDGNHFKIVKLLIPVSDPKVARIIIRELRLKGLLESKKSNVFDESINEEEKDRSLKYAAKYANHDIVDKLIDDDDPYNYENMNNEDKLISAVMDEDIADVKRLIKISNVRAYDSQALETACETRNKKIIELLIPHSDPKVVRKLRVKGLLESAKSDVTADESINEKTISRHHKMTGGLLERIAEQIERDYTFNTTRK